MTPSCDCRTLCPDANTCFRAEAKAEPEAAGNWLSSFCISWSDIANLSFEIILTQIFSRGNHCVTIGNVVFVQLLPFCSFHDVIIRRHRCKLPALPREPVHHHVHIK